jgi:Fe-S-cluster containining protein
MTFNAGNEIEEPDEALAFMRRQAEREKGPMPFVPWQRVRSRKDGEFWRWRCTELTASGRCGIYEDRPRACRVFEPGSDALCVHYRGSEGGDASAGL